MNISDLKEILKHFKEYKKGAYSLYNDGIYTHYFHKRENFYIIVTENNEVYQENSEHEKQGIELTDLDSFKIRFKSFTGEDLY